MKSIVNGKSCLKEKKLMCLDSESGTISPGRIL